MTIKPIKIDVSDLTKRLEYIRDQLGLSIGDVILRPHKDIIEPPLIDKKEFEGYFHDSGFLIHPKTGNPVFAYIKDHSIYVDISEESPENKRRLHFTICQKLLEFQRKDKFNKRYQITNRDDDLYPIEINNGREFYVPLYPCKHCLRNIKYKCYGSHMSDEEKEEIRKNFKSKEALDLIWQQFNIFKRSIKKHNLRPDSTRVSYTYDWDEISKKYRENHNFICEECKVNLSAPSLHALTDTHHIDSNKRNNQDNNLQCLCKECHRNIHHHYNVKNMDLYINIIRTERQKQKLI